MPPDSNKRSGAEVSEKFLALWLLGFTVKRTRLSDFSCSLDAALVITGVVTNWFLAVPITILYCYPFSDCDIVTHSSIFDTNQKRCLWRDDLPNPAAHRAHSHQAMPQRGGIQLWCVDVDAAECHADAQLPQQIQTRLQPLQICGMRSRLLSTLNSQVDNKIISTQLNESK